MVAWLQSGAHSLPQRLAQVKGTSRMGPERIRVAARRRSYRLRTSQQRWSIPMAFSSQRLQFAGHSGAALAARLDFPSGPLRAYALFAHCFTCSKDLASARRIAAELAREGIAVLRFDFTGLGSSEGEFASTNFSSNVADLVSAADYLRHHFQAPSLLVGHSLGGAAVLAAARDIAEVRAVATIGAPADVGHVLKNLGASLKEIETSGSAEVDLAGRKFLVNMQFVEDARAHRIKDAVASLKKPLLILHSPLDETVGIDYRNLRRSQTSQKLHIAGQGRSPAHKS
ncbi:UNVERIFIED_ORG: alpha/beta superfamily hydrolase [Ensifer adhaerens]|nr:alpha/beta superfamily hydrolase [Ensifer adhaerens]